MNVKFKHNPDDQIVNNTSKPRWITWQQDISQITAPTKSKDIFLKGSREFDGKARKQDNVEENEDDRIEDKDVKGLSDANGTMERENKLPVWKPCT